MTESTIERTVDALGDVVLAAFAVFVLFGQDWLETAAGSTATTVVAVVLVVLAGVVVAVDVRVLLRSQE